MLNRKNTSAVLHLTANSGNVVIVGNNSVSNLAVGTEIINGAYITQVAFGSPSGNAAYWEIKRGANVVLVVDSTCQLDFAGTGMSITKDATANLSANLIGATAGFLTIELQKIANTEYVNT
jgi:hypothetical protein